MTEVKRCQCTHEYQDKKYGRGLRVHNTVKGQSGNSYRCTVCGDSKGESFGKKGRR